MHALNLGNAENRSSSLIRFFGCGLIVGTRFLHRESCSSKVCPEIGFGCLQQCTLSPLERMQAWYFFLKALKWLQALHRKRNVVFDRLERAFFHLSSLVVLRFRREYNIRGNLTARCPDLSIGCVPTRSQSESIIRYFSEVGSTHCRSNKAAWLTFPALFHLEGRNRSSQEPLQYPQIVPYCRKVRNLKFASQENLCLPLSVPV